MALVLEMRPDWHVYWKNPGDSGLPTKLEWQLPPGFRAGPLLWPVPERFDTQGLITFGYSGTVLLLSEITPPESLKNGERVDLKARADWLACRVECTPGTASLGATLEVKSGPPVPDPAWMSQISAARKTLPAASPEAVFTVSVSGRQLVLHAAGIAASPDASIAFYPDASDSISLSASQKLSYGREGFDLRLERADAAPRLDRLQGVLVVGKGENARGVLVDAQVVGPSAPQSSGFAGPLGLLLALLLACAGGVILNLMPCVLPVISLKVLSLVRQAAEKNGRAPVNGLLFSAGVLLSFWVMAAILAAVRAGGRLLGWGFQLQDAAVVVAAATLFFLIALNFFGVFQIGTSLTRLGGNGTRGGRGAGSFLSGLFAAVVATPCTAPFMGAADRLRVVEAPAGDFRRVHRARHRHGRSVPSPLRVSRADRTPSQARSLDGNTAPDHGFSDARCRHLDGFRPFGTGRGIIGDRASLRPARCRYRCVGLGAMGRHRASKGDPHHLRRGGSDPCRGRPGLRGGLRPRRPGFHRERPSRAVLDPRAAGSSVGAVEPGARGAAQTARHAGLLGLHGPVVPLLPGERAGRSRKCLSDAAIFRSGRCHASR